MPVYVRIQQQIREGIASGSYKPGDRIPSEPALAAHFGTTRATVARALQELVFDGTIIRRAGSGSFVASRTPSVALDSRRLRSFEEQAAERGETVSYRLITFREETLPASIAAGLRVPPDTPVYHLERVRLIRDVPQSLESRFIPLEVGRRLTTADVARRSIHQILEGSLNMQIARIEVSVLAGTATARVGSLLGIGRGRPLLLRDHVLVSLDERPILAGRSYYTAQFRLQYVVQAGERETG